MLRDQGGLSQRNGEKVSVVVPPPLSVCGLFTDWREVPDMVELAFLLREGSHQGPASREGFQKKNNGNVGDSK